MNNAPENHLYSVCQQCNTNCGMRVRLHDGHIAKIEGNPFSPWGRTTPLPYATSLEDAAAHEGVLCPKGYAGIQTLYDPYRIKKVLKRMGKRGENRWQSMDFHEAIREVADGGNLFGEGHVQGLKDIASLRDVELMQILKQDAQAVVDKELSLEDFSHKHAAHLQHFIDPKHPDLGLKNNQICYSWGRQKGGRAEFAQRFFRGGLGSVNTHGHTTVCQGSLYFTCKAMSEQFVEGKFSGGKKFYWQADTQHAEFILFVGANPFEANYGPTMRAGKITQNVAQGKQRIAVVDPRLSKTAARAWKWIPVEPHGLGALGMGMLLCILEQHRYDARYLANCTKGAAMADNEPTWSQGAWLVKMRSDGTPGSLLRASDLGIAVEKRPSVKFKDTDDSSKTWDFDAFVAFHKGECLCFDPNDIQAQVHGELFVDTEIQGHSVKSVLQIYKEAAQEKSLEQWAEQAGTTAQEIQALAHEFTAHGKRAVIDVHRGLSQHTNGFYNVALWMTLNVLIGNMDWKGGLSSASTYDTSGKYAPNEFSITQGDTLTPWGISLIRHGVQYEKSTLFTGYPSKRVWFPFASDIYQEIVPSAGDAYPYPIKALFLYMAAPTYSLPAGQSLINILSDSQKIPLVVASDMVVGETSLYADYIFPDVSYLERWEFSGSHPSQVCKVAPVRQPVAAPLTDTVTVFGQDMPITWEATLLALAEYMQLPCFGEHGLGQNMPLKREEDMYLRMVANIAYGERVDGSQKVAAASVEEMHLFEHARRHLPSSVFDAQRWKAVVGADMWRHVVTVLNRGGRFQSVDDAYTQNHLTNTYGKMVGIYFDTFTKTLHSMTGKPYVPYGCALPSPTDCLGQVLDDRAQGYDLTLISYKTISQCKSRTSGNTWLRAIEKENFVEIAASDAARLGIAEGDMVKTVSSSNVEGLWHLGNGRVRPIMGKAKILQGLRPGVVAFSHGYGQNANGAADMLIDGKIIQGDTRRAVGISANAAMRVDPVLKNTCLEDTVGGSAVFYQTFVRLVKV